MYNNTNPAELYPSTTWELLPNDKFIKTGATPLQQNGNNSISISKANLPAEKIQLESFQLGKGTQEITGEFSLLGSATGNIYGWSGNKSSGAFSFDGNKINANVGEHVSNTTITYNQTKFTGSKTWTGMSTSATPYTQNLGSGTPISINPEHITVKAWKRLS